MCYTRPDQGKIMLKEMPTNFCCSSSSIAFLPLAYVPIKYISYRSASRARSPGRAAGRRGAGGPERGPRPGRAHFRYARASIYNEFDREQKPNAPRAVRAAKLPSIFSRDGPRREAADRNLFPERGAHKNGRREKINHRSDEMRCAFIPKLSKEISCPRSGGDGRRERSLRGTAATRRRANLIASWLFSSPLLLLPLRRLNIVFKEANANRTF